MTVIVRIAYPVIVHAKYVTENLLRHAKLAYKMHKEWLRQSMVSVAAIKDFTMMEKLLVKCV